MFKKLLLVLLMCSLTQQASVRLQNYQNQNAIQSNIDSVESPEDVDNQPRRNQNQPQGNNEDLASVESTENDDFDFKNLKNNHVIDCASARDTLLALFEGRNTGSSLSPQMLSAIEILGKCQN
ncbi:unnamed protein product [Caenorhabditis auriculariae]|uniref:Uncharacterized protein n=1 Tax=Caenorhabditis auriculariae TaxID=2777116 RepID=A0A8S1HVU7_9PELO|nr:unnamed protein product [Caenorhabditis auriculariae]